MSLKDLYTSSSAYTPTPSNTPAPSKTTNKKSGLSALLENTVIEQPTTTPTTTKQQQSAPPPIVQDQPMQTTTSTPATVAPKKSLFSKAVDLFSAGVEAVTGRPDYTTKPASTSTFKNTLRELPSAITETILPGVGAIRDNQDLVAEQNIGAKDLIKETPGQVLEAGKQFIKAPVSGALNLAGKPVSIKVPGLGEVSNSQYEASKRIANGEDPTIVALSEGGNAVLNSLFFFGLASKAFTPRPSAISAKGEATVPKDNGIPVDTGAKTGRLYQQPSITKPIDPATLQKIASENNIPISKDYNPANPTYFKMSGADANGKVTGQFFQLKPSYFDTFRTYLKGDPARVPSTQMIPVIEVKRDVAEVKTNFQQKYPAGSLDVGKGTTPAPLSNLRKLAEDAGVQVDTPAPVTSSQLPQNEQVTTPADQNMPKVIQETPAQTPALEPQNKSETPLVNSNVQETGIHMTDVPPEIQAKADEDWAQNFEAKSTELTNKFSELQTQLKDAPASQKKAIQSEINKVLNENLALENNFVDKWRAEADKVQAQISTKTQTKPNAEPNFHMRNADNKFVPAVGKKVDVFSGVDTFIHKVNGYWTLTEGRTGLKIVDGTTRAGTIQKAREVVAKQTAGGISLQQIIENAIKKTGLSPTYQPKKTFIKAKKPAPKKEPVIKTKPGEEASLASDFKQGKVAPASTPEELIKRIEQLNKFGQAHAILRRTGGLSKKASGIFRSQRGNPNDRGTVHLQDRVVSDPKEYMSVLGHELGHALEKAVTGETNVDTYRVFGKDLSAETKNKIKAELKAVTNEMEGEAVAKNAPGYYYKDTELLARFLQKMFESPGNLTELAPTAMEYFERSAVENPIVGEYLDAVRGTIDKGERKTIFARDMKQTYQKILGTRVGTMAWNDEVRYRAMKQRAIIQVEKLIKNKFKDVKDDPALLFQSAEAIKVTEGGVPEFGTRDFQYAKNDAEIAKLMEAGYKPLKENGKQLMEIVDGEAYPRFAKTRYTPEQGKALYDQLSPAGKKLIEEFTSAKAEAKDYFNREMIKDVNKINSNIEGWVHHYWEETGSTFGKNKLKTKVASAKKQRTGSEGYVEDLQKAMQKALTEIETAKAYNSFIDEYFARVTEPIAKGEEPKKGYVEVVGNVKKGGVGTSFENRTTVIQNGKAVPVQKPRYQMPAVIYERYKMIGEVAKEASTAVEVMNSINRYWRVNILFHPGSAMTNFISGGIQYSTKVLTDFYTEILTGSLKMEKTRANVGAMLTVLTPKGWNDAPDWVYGGDLSNYYGEFMTGKTPGVDMLNKSVDAYADKALKFYGYVERYWKKVIATSENVGDLSKLNEMTKEGLRLPTADEKQLLDEINSEVDLFAYDYDNVPVWLQNYSQSFFGQAIKPFAKYPYKYAKHVTEMATSIFDETQPKQERMAKLLALGTIMALYAYVRSKRKKEQKTPEVPETAPTSVSTRGRLFIGTDEKGNEIFTRVAKYPFLNITESGEQFLEGNSATGFQSITDMLGSIAPAGQLMASLFGYSNQFQMYTPAPVIAGQNVASFVPGTRILSDIARFFDPYQRKPTTFTQGLTSLIPLPSASEDLRAKLRGDIKTIQVPIEGNIKPTPGTKRTTVDQAVLNYKSDILYGLLGGIYKNRIDPETAKAFIIRKQENDAKAQKKAEKDATKTESKPVSLLKQAGEGVKSLFKPKVAFAEEMPQKKYYIRNNPISEQDLQEAKAILYAEISNRDPEKQKVEAQTILNTAFNRLEKYNTDGRKGRKNWTLTEVLQENQQYQGYEPNGRVLANGKTIESQYQKIKANKTPELSQQKIDAIDSMLAKVRDQSFINNIGDYRFYTHKPDGRIYATKLFKKL